MNKLLITIDPGFDSMKVIINGIVFKFPFNVERTDESNFSNYIVSDDFYLYRNEELKTWRVGQYARELIFENKTETEIEERMQIFYSEDRFLSEEFDIGIKAAIGIGLLKLEEQNSDFSLENLSNYEIFIMVTLPHATKDKYSSSVVDTLKGNHKFELRIGNNNFVSFDMVLKEENIYTVSQTIASIIGETSDDEGNIDKEKFFYLSKGPTLVIDSGYYTTGLIAIGRGGTIDNNKSESNTEHAMKSVNTKIADELSSVRPDIKHYVIEYLSQKDDGNVKYINTETNKAETININSIKDEKIKEVCDDFIKYLNIKYNNLLDFNYVLTTGGTGLRYYQHLKDYYMSNEILSENQLILSESTLYGKQYSIEYAIAIGAYKGLKGKTV